MRASLAGLILTLSPTVSALEFQCEIPNDTRYLRVEIPGREHLCEVSVTYLQSGSRQVLWYARNDTLFCSARAYELREKYENLWNYTCSAWPDRDGIDKLSQSQRRILDQRLKSMIEKGNQSTPAFKVTAVKAVASTPLDNEAGKIALQFFTGGTDVTEIIDDQSDTWSLTTSITDMANQVVSDLPITTALVNAISAEGTLEVHTRLVDEQNSECFGTQDLSPIGDQGAVQVRTPHRFTCTSSLSSVQPLIQAEPLDTETQTQ